MHKPAYKVDLNLDRACRNRKRRDDLRGVRTADAEFRPRWCHTDRADHDRTLGWATAASRRRWRPEDGVRARPRHRSDRKTCLRPEIRLGFSSRRVLFGRPGPKADTARLGRTSTKASSRWQVSFTSITWSWSSVECLSNGATARGRTWTQRERGRGRDKPSRSRSSGRSDAEGYPTRPHGADGARLYRGRQEHRQAVTPHNIGKTTKRNPHHRSFLFPRSSFHIRLPVDVDTRPKPRRRRRRQARRTGDETAAVRGTRQGRRCDEAGEARIFRDDGGLTLQQYSRRAWRRGLGLT